MNCDSCKKKIIKKEISCTEDQWEKIQAILDGDETKDFLEEIRKAIEATLPVLPCPFPHGAKEIIYVEKCTRPHQDYQVWPNYWPNYYPTYIPPTPIWTFPVTCGSAVPMDGYVTQTFQS